MKSLSVLFLLSSLAFALSPAEIRNQIKEQPPIILEAFKKTCEQSKEADACNATQCLNGIDQACMDYQKSMESGNALNKLDDPKMQQKMKSQADEMKKNLEKYSSPEDLKKIAQLKNDCNKDQNSSSCKQHDDLSMKLTKESTIKDAEEKCKSGHKDVCDLIPQLKTMLE